jgi:biotin carboxyl carrier protein
MRSIWRDGDRERAVEIVALGGGRYRVTVDEAPFELSAAALPDGRLSLTTEQGVTIAELTAAGPRRFVRLGALDFVLDRERGSRRAGAGKRAHAGGLESPMPGVVTRVMVKAGEPVEKGQPLLALEAMKMEHLIRAPRAGVVRTIAASVGQMVQGGVPLVELAEADG